MKKSIKALGIIVLTVLCFIVIVKADVHGSYGLLSGVTHISKATYLGKFYPKYWYKGVNYQSSYELSLNKQENGLYMHKSTRYPKHIIGEKYIKFDGYGSGKL